MAQTKEQRREYLRNYQRNWIKQRRAAFFSGKYCVQCQSTQDLELDHIIPSTKVSHNVWSWSEARRNAEIAKCQILCYDCHNLKTAAFNSRPITHGNSGYDRKCRCNICKAAHSERMKTRIR